VNKNFLRGANSNNKQQAMGNVKDTPHTA